MSNIHHKLRHVFIHVPKCAGTSMEHFDFVGGNGHATLEGLLRHDATRGENYWSWGFVRNPYDRAVSTFCAIQETRVGDPCLHNVPFYEYLRILRQLGTNRSRIPHTQPQVDFLTVRGRLVVDYIGRYESLQQDWQFVCNRLDVETPELPHMNQGDRGPWIMWYQKEKGTEKLQMVNDLYRSDFETLGYPMLHSAEELP